MLRAQEILAEEYGTGSDVWSVTSYKALRTEAMSAERWNRLHPESKPRRSYLEKTLNGLSGPFISASDNVRLVADQIEHWVPGRYVTLGTDGFGRSDTRERLRRFFEVDAPSIAIAALHQLAQRGKIESNRVAEAIREFEVDPEKVNPMTA